MLHVTGGGSRKLHGLKKDHVHWTQVSGAASKQKTARAQHLLMSSVGKSTDSAKDTVPGQKDKRKQRRRRARRKKLPVDTG